MKSYENQMTNYVLVTTCFFFVATKADKKNVFKFHEIPRHLTNWHISSGLSRAISHCNDPKITQN